MSAGSWAAVTKSSTSPRSVTASWVDAAGGPVALVAVAAGFLMALGGAAGFVVAKRLRAKEPAPSKEDTFEVQNPYFDKSRRTDIP